MTDSFSKLVELVSIPNKEAETVANAIFKIGFADMESQCKLSQIKEKSSATTYQRNFAN